MERAPAGARIVLDLLRRAKAGVELSQREQDLINAAFVYGERLWLTRYHADLMEPPFETFTLMGITTFERMWPKEAIEISKEVGWPDDIDSFDPGNPGVQSIPSAGDGSAAQEGGHTDSLD